MATWRADVFPDSSVGEISVEVKASTFHGAERQIRTIYGDVQYIHNLREVGMFSGGSSSSGIGWGTIAVLFGIFLFFAYWPWFLLIGIIWFIWNIFK